MSTSLESTSSPELALSPEQISSLTRIVFLDPIEIVPCDLIFIFGGTHPGAWKKGAEAYHRGLGQRVLTTGGVVLNRKMPHETWTDPHLATCDVIASQLVKLGLPEACIQRDPRATNTLEEVIYARELVDFEALQTVLFISKCYGVGRQYRTLRRHLPRHLSLLPYPFDTNAGAGPIITRSNWSEQAAGRRVVLAEYYRMLKYAAQGDIEPLTDTVAGLPLEPLA